MFKYFITRLTLIWEARWEARPEFLKKGFWVSEFPDYYPSECFDCNHGDCEGCDHYFVVTIN